MRSKFLCFVLLTIITIFTSHSVSDNKYNIGIHKYDSTSSDELIISHARQLLIAKNKELRRERKKKARHRKKETANEQDKEHQNEHQNEAKNNDNKNDENIGDKIDVDITKYNQQYQYHQFQAQMDKATAIQSKKTENINIKAIDDKHEKEPKNNIIINKRKNKRIFQYYKNGLPDFAFRNQNNENDNINKGDKIHNMDNNKQTYPAQYMAQTVIKSVKSPFEVQRIYEMNESWSRRTFWLLVWILVLNIFALVYCICGRSIIAYLRSMTQINNHQNIGKPKTLSDSDDITTEEISE